MISVEKKIEQEKCEPPPPPHFKTHHCIVLPPLFWAFFKIGSRMILFWIFPDFQIFERIS